MRCRTVILSSLLCMNAHANVLQYFAGISYHNPAELFMVKSSEFIIGATGFRTEGQYRGTQFNFNTFQQDYGKSYTKTMSLLPYGRIAKRYNKKLVLDVDVTQPFHSNLNWGNQSFTRYAATQTYVTDVDISPRASYQITRQWYLGGGLNFNFLKNNETNWALPSGPLASANLVNQTSGFGLGFNAGLFHIFNPTNFIGLSYFSSIKQQTRGASTFQNNVNNQLRFNFRMPATTVLKYVHIFNPKWLTNLQVFYTEWDANQYAIFRNTSAPPPMSQDFSFTMKFKPSVAFLGALRHQFNEKFGLTGIGMVDHGPERDEYRTLNFPADTQYFLALAADYHPSPTTTLELLYGYGWSNTIMNNHLDLNGQNIQFSNGRTRIHANILDLKLKIQLDDPGKVSK